MGHIRIGILPKYPKWRDLIGLLEDTGSTDNQIADKVLINSKQVLQNEATKTSIGYCVWLLSQLTLAARRDDFVEELADIDIIVSNSTSASEFLSIISSSANGQIRRLTAQNSITNIAELALRESLTRTIGSHANTLFGSGIPEVQFALKKYSTQKNYSNLLHTFFSSFLRRTLLFVLNKEIGNHLGPNKRFSSLEDISDFEISMGGFANQTARIVREFSGGWYSKKSWQEGDISVSDSKKFTHVAIKKLVDDLELNEVPQ